MNNQQDPNNQSSIGYNALFDEIQQRMNTANGRTFKPFAAISTSPFDSTPTKVGFYGEATLPKLAESQPSCVVCRGKIDGIYVFEYIPQQ